jgi:hypothetical protein
MFPFGPTDKTNNISEPERRHAVIPIPSKLSNLIAYVILREEINSSSRIWLRFQEIFGKFIAAPLPAFRKRRLGGVLIYQLAQGRNLGLGILRLSRSNSWHRNDYHLNDHKQQLAESSTRFIRFHLELTHQPLTHNMKSRYRVSLKE